MPLGHGHGDLRRMSLGSKSRSRQFSSKLHWSHERVKEHLLTLLCATGKSGDGERADQAGGEDETGQKRSPQARKCSLT